jgi:hypothetical protein
MSEGKKYIVEEVMQELGWVFNPAAGPDELPYKKLLSDGQEADVPFADWAEDSQRIFVETLKRLEDRLEIK